MEPRKILLSLAVHTNNTFDKMLDMIKSKATLPKDLMDEYCSRIKGDYVTIIDDDYPEAIKLLKNPPIVILLSKKDRDFVGDITSAKYLHYFN